MSQIYITYNLPINHFLFKFPVRSLENGILKAIKDYDIKLAEAWKRFIIFFYDMPNLKRFLELIGRRV